MEEMDRLANEPRSVVISCNLNLNLDYLIERIWEELRLLRIYTKKRGEHPDLTDPIVVRHGATIEHVVRVPTHTVPWRASRVGRQICLVRILDSRSAMVYGKSSKYVNWLTQIPSRAKGGTQPLGRQRRCGHDFYTYVARC